MEAATTNDEKNAGALIVWLIFIILAGHGLGILLLFVVAFISWIAFALGITPCWQLACPGGLL